MSKFLKQLLFISLGLAILAVGGLAIYSATPSGNLKVNPILGHDLDLNALYYAQAANNTIHDITTQDISISAWVKVDADFSGYRAIVSKRGTSGSFYYFAIDTATYGGAMYMYIYDGTDEYIVRATTNLRDNKWHYVSAIIDRDTVANCKIFLDGVDNTLSRIGTLANVDSLTNTTMFNVGANNGSTPFDGQVRDVKLYYAAGDHWTDAQVLYQAQHPFDYTANAGTLTDYWRLDEGTGTTLYGKANNLTLSNALAWTIQPRLKMVKQENATTTSNNPVGWWKFDETTAIHGSTLADSSGNGNTGTLSTGDGATEKSVVGKLGRGVSFDGVNDYVDCGTSNTIAPTTVITVSAWIKTSDTKAMQFIGGRGNTGASNAGWFIIIDNGNSIRFWVSNASTVAQPTKTYITGNWAHIVGVYDGTNAIVYVNGVAGTPVSLTPPIVYPPAGNPNTWIGYLQSQSPLARYFNGLIDDVRIYNRALSAGEVAQMYNSTKDGYLGNVKMSTGLVGYWKLDDNNALTSVIDYSGKGNTGTAYSGGVATATSVFSSSTAMIGRAMSFDGVNDYIRGVNVINEDTITFSVWVKTTASDFDPIIATHNSGYSNPAHGGIQINMGYPAMYVGYINSGWRFAVSSVSVNDGLWHYLIGVSNSSGSYIYVDGILRGSTSYKVSDVIYSPNVLNIGGNISGNFFNGLIDEVKIWNYARTGEQIANDYIIGSKHREE